MLVQHGLETSRKRHPDKVALVCNGQRLTYAHVDDAANRLANVLLERGLRPGDRVAIYLPNIVEAVIAIYGVLKAGGMFVVINRSTTFSKLSFILEDCGARCLISEARLVTDPTYASLYSGDLGIEFYIVTGPGQAAQASERIISFDSLQREAPADRPQVSQIDLDLACLVYTSGSTGEAKGVMCDHSNMVFVMGSVCEYLNQTADDVVLSVLPLAFSYGMYQVLTTFTFGGTLVLENSFAFPVMILERMVEERVTCFPGVPTIFATLLQMDLSQFDLARLRFVTNAAAALPSSQIRQLRENLPHVTIHSMYGLTETKRALHLPPDQIDKRPESVGVAIPGTQVWIEGSDGKRLGPNEVGELVVRGRHVMRGYWKSPEATAERFRPGPIPGERVCYTGDLFRMDDEGYMYFVGRKDEIIKTRGEKVAPREIEEVLHRLSGVKEVVVCGVDDPVLGQAVRAVLVADQTRLTARDVLAHCRAHLQDFQVPKYVEFRDELPKMTSGKYLKRAL